jgi:type II secretory pathway pseudopilin PulG
MNGSEMIVAVVIVGVLLVFLCWASTRDSKKTAKAVKRL